jgi:peroxiredoxin
VPPRDLVRRKSRHVRSVQDHLARIRRKVSTDDMETLSKFSNQACQGKFPVASDESKNISKSFDALMQTRPDYANRISYLIAPDGKVVFHYMSLNPTKHVERMLQALRAMPAKR